MVVVGILLILLVALLIVVPLLERSKFTLSNQQLQSISRWVLPLAIILVLAQLLRHLFM